jgi:hypothetical protein
MIPQPQIINSKFVPARCEREPKAPTVPFLETSFKSSVSSLLEHGYSFDQVQRMTGDEFLEIYETLRLKPLEVKK